MALMGAAFVGAVALHVMNWYHWKGLKKGAAAFVVLYLALAGGACNTKSYVAAPLIICFLHFPLLMGLFRFWLGHLKVSSRQFHVGLGISCAVSAVLVLIIWVGWLFAADMLWGEATKATYRNDMAEAGIFEVYEYTEYTPAGDTMKVNLTNWDHCVAVRGQLAAFSTCNDLKKSSGNTTTICTVANKDALAYCMRLELTGFLIYVTPLIVFGVLAVISAFAAMRLWMMAFAGPERIIKLSIFVISLLATACWVLASTAGASMGLADLFMASIGVCSFVFFAWLVMSVDLKMIISKCETTTVFKVFEPLIKSDWMTAVIFCATSFMILAFLALEAFTRACERVFKAGGPHEYTTNRGNYVIEIIRKQHWASNLEKSFTLCAVYIVFFICTKATPVFVAALTDALMNLDMGVILVIYYFVGVTMFMLPPVPGFSVYLAGGVIVVTRGTQDDVPWLGFGTGILFTTAFCLCIKLCAVSMQQKVIGEGFGRYLYVQQLVGVHTISIKAIEKILRRPGLGLAKVSILCAGPDWPTSVLTGILKLSLPQMLFGTLPGVCLIGPCVIAGAALLRSDMKSFSPMITAAAGAIQGGAGLWALLCIAKEAEQSHEELSAPRPEHAELIAKAEQASKGALAYKEATRWERLATVEKVCLVIATLLLLGTSWAMFMTGSVSFNKFEIGNQIDDDIALGGLAGDPLNLIRNSDGDFLYGAYLLVAFVVGVVFYQAYKFSGKARIKEAKKVATE